MAREKESSSAHVLYDITDQYKREVGLRAGSVILTIPPPTGSGWVNICVSFASSRFVPIDEVFEVVDL